MNAYTPNADVLTNTGIQSEDEHPPLEPKCTEPYYTKPVACIDKYGYGAIEPDYTTYGRMTMY